MHPPPPAPPARRPRAELTRCVAGFGSSVWIVRRQPKQKRRIERPGAVNEKPIEPLAVRKEKPVGSDGQVQTLARSPNRNRRELGQLPAAKILSRRLLPLVQARTRIRPTVPAPDVI